MLRAQNDPIVQDKIQPIGKGYCDSPHGVGPYDNLRHRFSKLSQQMQICGIFSKKMSQQMQICGIFSKKMSQQLKI
eukprot:scaffold8453_cov131-Amphora_coffeaeformis.AAC.5